MHHEEWELVVERSWTCDESLKHFVSWIFSPQFEIVGVDASLGHEADNIPVIDIGTIKH